MKESAENVLWALARKSARGPRYPLRETAHGLVTRTFAWVGWVLVAFGLLLLASVFSAFLPRARATWLPLALGGGFVLAGLLLALSRYSLEINWLTRTWREEQRFLGWVTTTKQGTLDDFAGLVLAKFRAPALQQPSQFWVISLDFKEQPAFYDLYVTYHEQQAREKLQYLAQRLKLPALDQTEDKQALLS